MTDIVDDVPPLTRIGAPLPSGAARLLGAALELFADKGFEATRTRDISALAGLSPAALYVHFSSKEELLYHLVRGSLESTLAALRAAVAPVSDPVERVVALVREFSRLHAESYQRARVAQYESRHLHPAHTAAVARIRRQIREVALTEVRRGQEAGVFTVEDPRVPVLAMMSLSVDICRWYRPGGAVTAAQLGDINADLILRILGASGRG